MGRKTIQEIRAELKAASYDMLPSFMETYREDPRGGVQKLVSQAAGRMKQYQQELLRLEKMSLYERRYDVYDYICGIDEAGRGPFAGPVCAAAVILPKNVRILYLNDSKKLSEKRREALYDEILEKALAVGVGLSAPQRIDEINILQADYEAMRQAVANLKIRPQVLLNDAVIIPGIDLPQESIIHGDARSVSIAAASVIAKVTRDRIMRKLDEQYPQYGFAKHKGYGTAEHIEALRKYGPCPEHRRSFIHDYVNPKDLPSPAAGGPQEAETDGADSTVSVGRRQEERACAFLERAGHRILERNFRCRVGEIDLISLDGGVLVFTEVKYRGGLWAGDPAEAVNEEKKYRISRAADYYRKLHGVPDGQPCRFDVIAITAEEIRHLENAFCYLAR